MNKPKKSIIEVRGAAITILSQKQEDYISLTDIARFKDSERTDYIIQNWLRNRNSIEFLGVWEQLNNPDLIPSNSMGLESRPASTASSSPPAAGSRPPRPSG